MDINAIRKLLDKLPDRTNYEWKNFEIESQGGVHRQMRHALLQYEQLHDQIDALDAEIKLAIISADKLASKKTKTKKHELRIVQSNINQKTRQLKQLQQRLGQVTEWLSQTTMEDIKQRVEGFEQYEPEHWSEELGRVMATELLADDHTQSSTMIKVSHLPLADYKKAVLICNHLSYFLRRTAENVEKSAIPNQPAGLSTDADR